MDEHNSPGALPIDVASRITKRTAIYAILTAGILMGLKAWAWWMSGSVSMLASLADSALDLAASLFTLMAVSYAATPADDEHRFGHGKAEGFAALFQAVLVGVSATLVAREAIERFMSPVELEYGGLALAVMGASILLTLGLIYLQTRAVRQTGSVATKGDRAHYAADLAANLAVIVGISSTAFLGISWADPIIGLGVALWLAYSALDVARAGYDQLLDRELPDDSREEILNCANSVEGVLGVHALRTRASGPYIHIQCHVDLPPDLSLMEAHQIMVEMEAKILSAFPAADILIHPDPKGHAETHGLKDFRQEDEPNSA